MKCKQQRPGFELRTPGTFHTTTFTLRVLPVYTHIRTYTPARTHQFFFQFPMVCKNNRPSSATLAFVVSVVLHQFGILFLFGWLLNQGPVSWVVRIDTYIRLEIFCSGEKYSTSNNVRNLSRFSNWITMTRKSGKHLRTTYRTTEQLFWPYQVSSALEVTVSPVKSTDVTYKTHSG